MNNRFWRMSSSKAVQGRRRVWARAVAVCLCAWVAAAAETTGPLVREVLVRDPDGKPVEESFVLAHIDARTGMTFDRSAVLRDVRTLLDTKRFTSVEVRAEQLDNGVRVIYLVKNRFRLSAPADIEGADHFRDGRIREWLGIDIGDYVDDQVLGAGAKKVEAKYSEERYPDAKVTWEFKPTPGEEHAARVLVKVKEGERSSIRLILFEGNLSIPADELVPLAKPEKSWWNPLDWFRKHRYDPDQLEEARRNLLQRYRDDGFLDVDVGQAKVLPLDEGKLAVTFPVTEGPKYSLREIKLSGSGLKIFPEADLQKLMTLKSGEVASQKSIDSVAQNLQDYFGNRGYYFAVVKPLVGADKTASQADLAFDITEGDLIKIRNVLIRGNTRTKDKVIRRELLVYPGEVIDESRVRKSENRLTNLGFFEPVRSQLLSSGTPSEMDLLFDVDEKRTGQFSIGAGFSSIDNLMGFTELSQGNFDILHWPTFTGGGQKLKTRVQYGESRQSYDVSFVEPWFLDRRLALGNDLFLNTVSYDEYDLKRLGGAVSLGWALPGANRMSVRYLLEGVSITDVTDTNLYEYVESPHDTMRFAKEENRVESSAEVTVTHDTRDNPFVPKRGNRSTITGRLVGGPLGFETDIYELGFRSKQYVPLWFGHVLSLMARSDFVDSYGDTDEVPLSSRLFLGGGQTIRGFDYRDVGPKVQKTKGTEVDVRPAGGCSLVMGSAEYSVPVVTGIRVVAFYDIGNLWRDPYEIDLTDMASGAGVGIRLDVPGFPMRVDRAWRRDRDDKYSGGQEWVIWIGYDY